MNKRIAITLLLLLSQSTAVVNALSQSKKPITRSGIQPAAQSAQHPIFIFHTDEFWLNLHHFLYVLGRAQNKERDMTREAVVHAPADEEKGMTRLNAKQQTVWREAVASYAADWSKKDLVFDDSAAAVTSALAKLGGADSLAGAGLDPAVAATLERAAPIYRKAWWKEHEKANRDWKAMIEPLLARHGPTVLAFITNAYKLDWPAGGYPVHLSGYSNWAGAYSIIGNLLVVSSLSKDTTGPYALETIFHEAMHQWDEQVHEALRAQARQLNKRAPNISHALIFYTAGYAVRRVFPEHVPYAEKFGVWNRGIGPYKSVIEEVWKPYLEGKGSRDEAFAEMIKRLPEPTGPRGE